MRNKQIHDLYAVEHYANADSEMGRAVYATLETLTLFFRWLDNKHKPSDQPRSSRHWWSAFINRWSRARERL